MSLTLPVEQWTWPGAILQLFRVNPDTGALEAAVGVNGLAVIGTVDADGMSATFSGIAGLSVVVGALPDPIPVTIDIKPAESANSINLRSLGNVPVAMLSSASFDAQTVNLETVTLLSSSVKVKRNGEAFAAVEDVNGDGLPDVVVHFDTEALQLGDLDQEAVLEAWTTGGLRIRGVDTLRVVP
jgi:hypothetical protein